MEVNKKKLLSMYIFILIILFSLPINNTKSALNNSYVFALRADYISHILIYLPWIWLRPINKNLPSIWLWFAGGIAFAGFSEGIQYLLPYRSFNINDLLANVTGIILSILSYFIFHNIERSFNR